jgi:uncharacterized protein YegL
MSISFKLTLFIGLILLLSCCSVFGQKKVLHLEMDYDGFNDRVFDSSKFGNEGDIIGNLEFVDDRFGNACRALSFNGSGYISINHHSSLNLSSGFTLTTWVNLPSYSGLQWLTLICKGERSEETDNSPSYRVQFTSGTASVNTASTKSIGTIRLSFPRSKWVHIAVTYDNQKLVIFEDGRKTEEFIVYDHLSDNREGLNIGRDIPGATEYFVGVMDDLTLWSGILSNNQINQIYRDNSAQGAGSACNNPDPDPDPAVVVTKPNPKKGNNNPNLPDWGTMKEQKDPPPTPQNDPSVVVTDPQPKKGKNQPNLPVWKDMKETKDPKPTPPPVPPIPNPPARDTDIVIVALDTISFDNIAENNLVLLLDVSGSMKKPERLPLLKNVFLKLISRMRQEDMISVVTYSGGIEVVLDGVSATKQKEIKSAITNLSSAGTTEGKAGLERAFRIAESNFIDNGNNRIILATDGEFELRDLFSLSKKIQKKGIYLSVFSFGKQNAVKSAELREIADRGDGQHTNITEQNIEAALIREVKAIRKK